MFQQAVGTILAGLVLCSCQGQYAQIYLRALDPETQADAGATVYLGEDGQILTPRRTPTEVSLTRSCYWYPGKVVSLVFDTPGYRTAIRLTVLDKWANTPAEAALNANNVDVLLVKDVSRQAR